jgi:hypothetical protein
MTLPRDANRSQTDPLVAAEESLHPSVPTPNSSALQSVSGHTRTRPQSGFGEPSSGATDDSVSYEWARTEFTRRGFPYTEGELRRRVQDADGISFAELIAELERVAEGK